MKWHIVWVMWSRGAQVSSPLSFFAQTQRELYWIRERQSLREHVYVDIEPRCLDERTVFSRAPAAPGWAGFTLKPSSGSACNAETAAHFVAPEPCLWETCSGWNGSLSVGLSRRQTVRQFECDSGFMRAASCSSCTFSIIKFTWRLDIASERTECVCCWSNVTCLLVSACDSLYLLIPDWWTCNGALTAHEPLITHASRWWIPRYSSSFMRFLFTLLCSLAAPLKLCYILTSWSRVGAYQAGIDPWVLGYF